MVYRNVRIEFGNRLADFMTYKERTLRELKEELAAKKGLGQGKERNSSRANVKQSQELLANRLIEQGESACHKRRRLFLEREIAQDAECEKECTFNPAINSKTARSRYFETSQNKRPSLGNDEFTFRPAINSRTGSLLKKNSSYYSSVSPFERLYSRKNSKKALETVKVSTVPRAKIDLKQFIQRQEVREKIKKEKLELSAKSVSVSTVSLMNKNSKKIAAKLGDFDMRMRTQQLKYETVETIGADWFRPKINTKINYTVTVPSVNKGKKLANTVVEQPPKTAKSKQYSNVQSKLKLNTDINTLISRIRNDKELKERSSNQEKQVKRLEEELRCTYKPKISTLPNYLSRTANTSARHNRECRELKKA
eukprot:TRINITY_DN11156_c0_g1_i2.p1 TRINITY_DN11156_c0_g1~~TRINITY_DN11156_c0_g1_i2.p1  ORF type:complete len:367 (+),score=131.00 TRINITY_DN11156_c0_g1_i2:293-1393(+)